MKRFSILFVLLLSLISYGQTDTAQVIVPNRTNTPEALNKPYVILISADGFRYDYIEKYRASHLKSLADRGTWAKAMRPSYPSVTGPNHYALITGLYPSHSGFVDNYFYDLKRKDFFAMSRKEKITDGSWLNGLPLWGLAENAGVLSASLFWVASNGTAGGTRPTYYYDYHEKFNAKERVDIVVNWLKLPEEKRPHFISMYFFEVDKMGHLYGPDAEETKEAVKMVDQAVGELARRVEELGLKNVHFVFVSDHGMIGVDTNNPLSIPHLLYDENKYVFVNAQTLLRIQVKNPRDIQSTFKQLKRNKTSDYKVFLATNFPRRLHYSKEDDRFGSRMGDIYLVPKKGKIFLGEKDYRTPGKHGYDPRKVKEMDATFFGVGPKFKEGKRVGRFENVNVYPIIAEILDLPITHPIDGSDRTSRKVLK